MSNERIIECGEQVETYRDFVKYYNINNILNNEIIKYHDFDVVNGSLFKYLNSETGEEIDPNDIWMYDFDEYDEQVKEIFQFFIVDSFDAERIMQVAPSEIVFYDWETDCYLWGVDFLGDWEVTKITTKFNQ